MIKTLDQFFWREYATTKDARLLTITQLFVTLLPILILIFSPFITRLGTVVITLLPFIGYWVMYTRLKMEWRFRDERMDEAAAKFYENAR